MKLRSIYLTMTVVGCALPLTQLIPWLAAHGLDVPLFGRELFANHASSFFALDLLLTALIVIFQAARERERLHLWWLPIAATLCIGVSAGLPLLLYLNESAKSA